MTKEQVDSIALAQGAEVVDTLEECGVVLSHPQARLLKIQVQSAFIYGMNIGLSEAKKILMGGGDNDAKSGRFTSSQV